ncbi:MAG TPA: hypothetical protein VGH89_23400 [Pseudonocardia sp.]|jgi:hypothetical protein
MPKVPQRYSCNAATVWVETRPHAPTAASHEYRPGERTRLPPYVIDNRAWGLAAERQEAQ